MTCTTCCRLPVRECRASATPSAAVYRMTNATPQTGKAGLEFGEACVTCMRVSDSACGPETHGRPKISRCAAPGSAGGKFQVSWGSLCFFICMGGSLSLSPRFRGVRFLFGACTVGRVSEFLLTFRTTSSSLPPLVMGAAIPWSHLVIQL